MNKERLLRLADFLEKEVPAEQFNMERWATGEVGQCGTMACAFGWATKIPEFASAGLKLSLTPFDDDGREVLSGNVHFHDWCGFEAARLFFDISDTQASYLFYDGNYMDGARDIGDVVARIRDFVAKG
jgi:hypothetical protein